MKYIMTINAYNKMIKQYTDTKKVFDSLIDAVQFLAIVKPKMKEYDSITIVAEKQH